ncbi:hypothetical protein MP228_004879 [Amoeboaphelidium protococcarum]|nr:hypothetical protein MP228_004879 [Amoeboaphelidium protococcarum]
MKRTRVESSIDLLEFYLYELDSELFSYLTPDALLELSMCCKWLQQFVVQNKRLVKLCYFKYFGPCMTALKIYQHKYLELESTDDYMYFLDDSITLNEALKQFLFSVKDRRLKNQQFAALIPDNWIMAMSFKFDCHIYNVDGEQFQDFYNLFRDWGLMDQFDNNELLCLDEEDLNEIICGQLRSQLGQPFKSKAYGFFAEFVIENGFGLMMWDEEELTEDRVNLYINTLGPLFRGPMSKYVRSRFKDSAWYREYKHLIGYIQKADNLSLEQCQYIIADKFASSLMSSGNSGSTDNFFDLIWAVFDSSRNDVVVEGLTEDALWLIDYIPCEIFCQVVMPAFYHHMPQNRVSSILVWFAVHYCMFDDPSNSLYELIAARITCGSSQDYTFVIDILLVIVRCRIYKYFEIQPISQSLIADEGAAEKCRSIVLDFINHGNDKVIKSLGIPTIMRLFHDILGDECSLHKYLGPKDLLELSLSTKWLQSFVLQEKKFTRDLYWHYYGPKLAAFRIKDHSYLNLHSKQDYAYFMHDSLRSILIDDVSLRRYDPLSWMRQEVDEVISQSWRDAINEFVNRQTKSSNGQSNIYTPSKNGQDEASSLLQSVVHLVAQNVDAVDIAALQAKFGQVEITPYRRNALADHGHLYLIKSLSAMSISFVADIVVTVEDFFNFRISSKGHKLFIDYLWKECQRMSWSVFRVYTVYLRHTNQLPDPIYRRLCTRYLKLSFIKFIHWQYQEIISICEMNESDETDVQMDGRKKFIISDRRQIDSDFIDMLSMVDYREIESFLGGALQPSSGEEHRGQEPFQIIIAILDFYSELQNVDNIIFNDIKRAIGLYKVNAQSRVEAFCRYAIYNLPKDYCLLNEIVNSSDLARKNAIWIMTQFEDEKYHEQLFEFMLRQIGPLTLDEQVYAFSSVLSARSVVNDIALDQPKQSQGSSSLNQNSKSSKAQTLQLDQLYSRITCMVEKLGGFDMVHSFLINFKIQQISTKSARLLSRLLVDLNCRDAYTDVEQIAAHVALQYLNGFYNTLGVLLSSYLTDGVPFALSVAAVKEQSSKEQLQALCNEMTVELCTQLGFQLQDYDSFTHQLLSAIKGLEKTKLPEMARILKLVYESNHNLNLSQDAHNALQQLLGQILKIDTSHSKIYKALPAKAYQDQMWHVLYLRVLINMNKSPKTLRSEIQSLWNVIVERVSGLKSNRGVKEIYEFKFALLEVTLSLPKTSKCKKILQEFKQVVESARVAQSQKVKEIRAENIAKKARIE